MHNIMFIKIYQWLSRNINVKMACFCVKTTPHPRHCTCFTMYINFKQDFCSHAGFCACAHSPTFTCLRSGVEFPYDIVDEILERFRAFSYLHATSWSSACRVHEQAYNFLVCAVGSFVLRDVGMQEIRPIPT